MSWTKGMRTGAAFGDGIYLAEDLKVAMNFVQFSSKNIWKKWSLIRTNTELNVGCVAACEVICHPNHISTLNDAARGNYFIVKDEHHVKLHSLLIYCVQRPRRQWTPFMTLSVCVGAIAVALYLRLR